MRQFNKLLLVLLVLFVGLLIFPAESKASVLFEDNFNDGQLDDWIQKSCIGKWSIESGRLHILVGTSSTICEIYTGDPNWESYILEYEFTPVAGVDKNIRYYWTSQGSAYEFHFNSEGLHAPDGNVYSIYLQNGKTYHLKLVLNKSHHQLYIDDVKVYDHTILNYVEKGAIGFRVGTGAAYPTEVYFDNVKVTSISEEPTVPYYSQNHLDWRLDEYDHASSLKGFGNPHFERWGCAVTSAAMVLNYNGMKELEDGSDLNPGSLNEWLKNNEGYLTGVGKDGPYSYLLWGKISELSKSLFESGKSDVKLEHKRISSENTPLDSQYHNFVKNLISVDNIPSILNVKSDKTDSHFVVASGESDGVITINDPEWDYATLASFDNKIYQIDYFKPSNTDLSYIVTVINPSIEILVTDPDGNRTGKLVTSEEEIEIDEILDGYYGFSAPISNPDSDGKKEELGTGVNEFLLPQPESGSYRLNLSSTDGDFYTLNIATYNSAGESNILKVTGFAGVEGNEEYNVNFSKNGNSDIDKIVSYESLKLDVEEAFRSEQIVRPNIKNILLRDIRGAEREDEKGRIERARTYLNSFIAILNEQRQDSVTEIAYQVLLSDAQTLLETLE